MPVIAVAGIYMGATAIAAGGLTAFGTIAAIGSIVGGIGVLTGNKTLTAIGAVAGLAGGVGAFAQSQGWMASGSAGSALGDTANNTAAMANAPSSQLEGVAPTVDTGAVAVDAGTGANVAEQVVDQGSSVAGVSQGTTATNITQGSQLADSSGLMNAGAPNTSVLGGPAGPSLSKAALDGTNSFGANSVAGAGSAAAPGGSIFDTLKGGFNSIFRNPDGTMNKDMLSLTGNFVGGMFDDKKQAETDYLKAQADALNQQMANASDVPHINMALDGKVKFNKKPTAYQRPGGLMYAR